MQAAAAALVALISSANAPSARVDVFDGEEAASAVSMDSDGKAHPYAVVYAGPGLADRTQEALCGSPGQRVWSFQVTAAGGDLPRCRRAAYRVLLALEGSRINTAGITTGPVRQAADPGSPQKDATVNPPRHYLPLLFTAEIP